MPSPEWMSSLKRFISLEWISLEYFASLESFPYPKQIAFLERFASLEWIPCLEWSALLERFAYLEQMASLD